MSMFAKIVYVFSGCMTIILAFPERRIVYRNNNSECQDIDDKLSIFHQENNFNSSIVGDIFKNIALVERKYRFVVGPVKREVLLYGDIFNPQRYEDLYLNYFNVVDECENCQEIDDDERRGKRESMTRYFTGNPESQFTKDEILQYFNLKTNKLKTKKKLKPKLAETVKDLNEDLRELTELKMNNGNSPELRHNELSCEPSDGNLFLSGLPSSMKHVQREIKEDILSVIIPKGVPRIQIDNMAGSPTTSVNSKETITIGDQVATEKIGNGELVFSASSGQMSQRPCLGPMRGVFNLLFNHSDKDTLGTVNNAFDNLKILENSISDNSIPKVTESVNKIENKAISFAILRENLQMNEVTTITMPRVDFIGRGRKKNKRLRGKAILLRKKFKDASLTNRDSAVDALEINDVTPLPVETSTNISTTTEDLNYEYYYDDD